mgnify:CR=1 FL=1
MAATFLTYRRSPETWLQGPRNVFYFRLSATATATATVAPASGGGTGRTLHPDNMAAGPASYGMTDTMGRMHSDAQFAGSSSVPAHVEMIALRRAGGTPEGPLQRQRVLCVGQRYLDAGAPVRK